MVFEYSTIVSINGKYYLYGGKNFERHNLVSIYYNKAW